MTYKTPEVALLAKTTIRTIRHWENVGLLGIVARDRRGDRAFTQTQVDRAKLISAATMAGMGLEEIRKTTGAGIRAKISEACVFMQSVTGFDL